MRLAVVDRAVRQDQRRARRGDAGARVRPHVARLQRERRVGRRERRVVVRHRRRRVSDDEAPQRRRAGGGGHAVLHRRLARARGSVLERHRPGRGARDGLDHEVARERGGNHHALGVHAGAQADGRRRAARGWRAASASSAAVTLGNGSAEPASAAPLDDTRSTRASSARARGGTNIEPPVAADAAAATRGAASTPRREGQGPVGVETCSGFGGGRSRNTGPSCRRCASMPRPSADGGDAGRGRSGRHRHDGAHRLADSVGTDRPLDPRPARGRVKLGGEGVPSEGVEK